MCEGPRYPFAERIRLGETDTATTLRFWMELFEHSVEPQRGSAVDTVDTAARQWGPRALGELYRANGAMTLGKLTELLLSGDAGDVAGTRELLSGVSLTEIGLVMLNAVEHGAATVEPGGDGASMFSADTFVELTPLGRYAVRQRLLGVRVDAPLEEPTQ